MNPEQIPNPNTKIYLVIIILVVLIAAGGLFMFYKISQKNVDTGATGDPTDVVSTPKGVTTAEEDLSKDVLSDINYDIKAGI